MKHPILRRIPGARQWIEKIERLESERNRLARRVEKLEARLESLPEKPQQPGRSEYKAVWTALSETASSAQWHIGGVNEEAWFQATGLATKETLTSTVGIHQTDTFVEIGCGVGRVGKQLAPLCQKWVGCDVSPHMLSLAAQRLKGFPNVELHEISGFDLQPLANRSADVVYSTVVFMHLEEWDRYNYVLEACRVLRPGGRIYIDNVNLCSEEGWKVFESHRQIPPDQRPPHMTKHSTVDELKTYLRRAGFRDIRAREVDHFVQVWGTKGAALEELPSRRFEALRYALGAWTEHIFCAYDLVAQLRPQLVVELGTDRGESYFAFCQSALENRTGTRCFAIDHWQGDSHAGSYDETTFADVTAHNRLHYEGFSTLLRTTFDEALQRFGAESIDLLHIDGHHTEEAVRHDVEAWLLKLRSGGILLMHDVTVRGRNFGVWKVWEELTARGRSFTFAQPPGLGIWEKPPMREQPPLFETLFGPANEERAAVLQSYRQCNAELQARIATQWRDGTIRSAPMARETVIQFFWSSDGSYAEENSTDVRIGHEEWKDVAVKLPTETPIRGLRIDFYSPLTMIEIAVIEVHAEVGAPLYRAENAAAFDSIALLGDCLRRSLDPFCIEVTGVDPQLHLPPFPQPERGLEVRMRLRVRATAS